MAILARREGVGDCCFERQRTNRYRSGGVTKVHGVLGIRIFQCLDPPGAWNRIVRRVSTKPQSNESAATVRVTHV